MKKLAESGAASRLGALSWTSDLYLCRVREVRARRSIQTKSVLAALLGQRSQWCHGYALAKQTGLKSGTLYPILIRLAEEGLVEACWQDEPRPGRPRRHLYRLTAEGSAVASLEVTAEPVARADVRGARSGNGAPAPGIP